MSRIRTRVRGESGQDEEEKRAAREDVIVAGL